MKENLLKSKRTLNGFTQESMAKNIGISTKTYNRKELKMSDFTIGEVINISKLLKLSPKDINLIFFDGNLPIV